MNRDKEKAQLITTRLQRPHRILSFIFVFALSYSLACRRKENFGSFFTMSLSFRNCVLLAVLLLVMGNMPKLDIENTTVFSSTADCSPKATKNSLPDTDFGGSPWCPNAICPNSDLCHPCRRRFLILIATGRSASTTLTYMLNSLPGIRMSGENNDELKAIRRMIDNIRSKITFGGMSARNMLGDTIEYPMALLHVSLST